MAQKPHERSQPSAIFTYAHGDTDVGRGRLSRSSSGNGADETGINFLPTVDGAGVWTGTPNPATTSS